MVEPASPSEPSPDLHHLALDAIYRALDGLDDGTQPGIAPAPDTVLIGATGLSSLGFVTFAVTLEEELQRIGLHVSVMDIAARNEGECTIDRLATMVAEATGARGR